MALLSLFLHGFFWVQNFWFFSIQPWYPSDFLSQEKSPFPAFPDPEGRWGTQTLKGCSKSKLAIAFLNWRDFGWAKQGDDLEKPKKNPKNPTNFECDVHEFFSRFSTIFVHFLKDQKKKRNQQQTYPNRVAACGVQSNTPQTGNSLVSHPFSWRRNQPTTEKPLVSPPPFIPQYPTTPPFFMAACNKRWYRSRIPKVEAVFQVKVLVSGLCWG